MTHQALHDPPTLDPDMLEESSSANEEDKAVVWWIVAFVGVFQALHSITDRAVTWLIHFLSTLLMFLATLSKCDKIQRIYHLFPNSLYRFKQYINNRCGPSEITKYAVCSKCETLYSFDDCIEKRREGVYVSQMCSHDEFGCAPCTTELLKKIVSKSRNPRIYPHKVYCYTAIMSSLQRFFRRPGFFELIESTRSTHTGSVLCDVFQGQIWKDFLNYCGEPFLLVPLCYAVIFNIDWFQPYEHYKYSVGVIYLALLNLPRGVRYKRENIILVGIIPGPSEPSLHINTYLAPLVTELLDLWKGVSIEIDGVQREVRVVLICVACDTPAARKVCGFLGHSANLGCPKCYCEFSEGGLARNRSNFDCSTWRKRTNATHRASVREILKCNTKTAREAKESSEGCRFSALLNLPYFDPVRMTVIDGMHNIFLGSAKYFVHKILIATGVNQSFRLSIAV